ncbi:MAG TPA: cell division protein FtsZ [Verrucomicrobiae bacterium]
MDESPLTTPPAIENTARAVCLKVLGIGNAGMSVLELLVAGGFPAASTAAINSDLETLQASSLPAKVPLETKLLRGLGSGGDPERGRTLAEEHAAAIKELCRGSDLVFITAGLGGGCGTGAGPIVARLAKETGALVVAFLMTPFDCEGSRRQHLAQKGLEAFREAADAVICLPNQKLFKTLEENTSVLGAFKLTDELLADAVRSFWHLATHKGLIDLHFGQLCELLRDQHTESAFAVAEAMGPTRSREVVEKLLGSPLLDGGAVLPESDSILVSLMGGPDLTIADVNRVMEEIASKCEGVQVTMGAAIHQDFQDRLGVTIIAARCVDHSSAPVSRPGIEGLQSQLLSGSSPRSGSRFVPPPPTLRPEQVEQLIARQGRGRGQKGGPRFRQAQLPLEIVSKGRFDKSEPTIHKGEDLDVPTYIRRGVALN